MRLVIFDCDGTLVDSQHLITAAMCGAFEACDLPPLLHSDIHRVIGLSLSSAIMQLAPEQDEQTVNKLCRIYRQVHRDLRQTGDYHEPLFDGVLDVIETLLAEDNLLLGIATGKSRRGLMGVLEHHALTGRFATLQTADDAPSKPHPAMLHQAIAETGASAAQTIMIGDTSFDMMMAAQANTARVGVAWGLHPERELRAAGAQAIATTRADLPGIINQLNPKSAQ